MKSILVIEDNKDIRENTAEILDLAGYKTFTAENGKKGVDIAVKEKPDVIVCDIMMPELDGYGVLHILSKKTETAQIPFIFLTAKTQTEDVIKGFTLGGNDYIRKPFSMEELRLLLERVSGHLKLKTENRTLREKIKSKLGFGSIVGRAGGDEIINISF
jgi:DNA-binding response OmpR family regulator